MFTFHSLTRTEGGIKIYVFLREAPSERLLTIFAQTAELRVPRGKGRITVTCRGCGASFEEKS